MAAAAVFGIPFLHCLLGALRGHLFLGRYLYFAKDASVSGLAAWGVAAALGLSWLGVSLQLGLAPRLASRTANAWAAGLTLLGVSLLLFCARLLSLRVTA